MCIIAYVQLRRKVLIVYVELRRFTQHTNRERREGGKPGYPWEQTRQPIDGKSGNQPIWLSYPESSALMSK